ncbi:hypothetical protein DPMN_032132 [Dreissena polymorpha]|uniref:MULE transposase domain-containing protein n=1 Tax=Dreissena polymorpha TaxID=45954 RepID=A0A9D4M4E8_DREPO|nr:hypothetical protein DPMN_032132 [Dreissena polymorpha]
MDGTHSTAPRQFAQLFCIQVPLGKGHATAAYGLLPGKQQEHYKEFLTVILDACLREDVRPSPSTVIIDYETAIHNAVLSVILSQNIKIQVHMYIIYFR